MGLKNAKEGKLLYHLTELKNLESIIDSGLVPRKILRENTVTFGDVADPEIIRKREVLGLDEYIPFHFHPYSAFDVAVKKTHAGPEVWQDTIISVSYLSTHWHWKSASYMIMTKALK